MLQRFQKLIDFLEGIKKPILVGIALLETVHIFTEKVKKINNGAGDLVNDIVVESETVKEEKDENN